MEISTPDSSESFRPDEMDLPSGMSIIVRIDGKDVQKEMTFRELHAYTAKEIRLWDSLEARDRLTVQKAYDPNYRPISPFEGTERSRANRGRRPSVRSRSSAGR